jgi:MFS family permease
MIQMAIQYMFWNTFNLNPSKATQYITYTNLPWSFKLFYGITTDCLPICGSTKRSYIFVMGMLQCLTCLAIVYGGFDQPGDAVYVMLFATINSIGGGFMDVVIDGLMVVNSRLDPVAGSEDLQSWSWTFYGVGGIVGCILAGYFLSGYDEAGNPAGNPYACYLIMAGVAAVIAVSGLFIDKKLEGNQAEMVKMGVCARTGLVFREVGQGMKLKELYTAVIYQTILGAVVPWFGTYLYYYQIEVTGF